MNGIRHFKRHVLFFFFYVGMLFLVDWATKQWAMNNINRMMWLDPYYPYGGIPLFHDFFGIDFSLNYAQNTGTAWSLFSDYPIPLLIARIGVVVSLLVYLFFYLRNIDYALPFTLILGGAFCNIYDCLAYGFVIDLFHFKFFNYHFPIFNCADISICIGIGWLFYLTWRERFRTSSEDPFKLDVE